MLLVARYKSGYDVPFGAHAVSTSGFHAYLPGRLALRVNGGCYSGFGNTGVAGFTALYATPDAVYLHLRRRVHRLHHPPVSMLTRGNRNVLRVTVDGRNVLQVAYRPVAARWPYKGTDVSPDEEEDADFYLWLHNNLTRNWDSMRSSFSPGWAAG